MAGTRAREVRTLVAICLAVVAGVVISAEPRQKYDEMMGDRLFAEYQANGEQVLARAFPTNARFEAFRKDFRVRVLTQWEAGEHKPAQAMFMLDVAITALNVHDYLFWLDFIQLGGKFLRERPEPPGARQAVGGCESRWHKTALALLEGRRRTDFVADAVNA